MLTFCLKKFATKNCFLNLFLFFRNAFLANMTHLKMPKFTKTGTTICGAVFKHGVVVGADTRATSGDIVADKNCMKIHPLAPNMVCCGAGTAADCDKVSLMIQSQLELLRLNSDRQQRVATANRLFKQMLFRYQVNIKRLKQQKRPRIQEYCFRDMLVPIWSWQVSTVRVPTCTPLPPTDRLTRSLTLPWVLAVWPPWRSLKPDIGRIWRKKKRKNWSGMPLLPESLTIWDLVPTLIWPS